MDTVIETKRDSRIEKRSRSLINIILSDKVTQVRRYPFPSVLFESQKLQPRKFIAPRLDCSKSNAVDASKTRSTNRTNHHAKPTSFLLPSFLPSFLFSPPPNHSSSPILQECIRTTSYFIRGGSRFIFRMHVSCYGEKGAKRGPGEDG